MATSEVTRDTGLKKEIILPVEIESVGKEMKEFEFKIDFEHVFKEKHYGNRSDERFLLRTRVYADIAGNSEKIAFRLYNLDLTFTYPLFPGDKLSFGIKSESEVQSSRLVEIINQALQRSSIYESSEVYKVSKIN